MKTIQEEFAEELNNFRSEIIKLVKGFFSENKSWPPTMILLIKKGEAYGIQVVHGLGMLFANDDLKEIAAETMKKINREMKPLAVAFIQEAWVSEYPQENVLDEDGNYREGVVRPSKDPRRIDSLFVSFESHDKESIMMWEIVTSPEGNKSLKDRMDKPWDKKSSKGRFTDLLKENNTELAKEVREQFSPN